MLFGVEERSAICARLTVYCLSIHAEMLFAREEKAYERDTTFPASRRSTFCRKSVQQPHRNSECSSSHRKQSFTLIQSFQEWKLVYRLSGFAYDDFEVWRDWNRKILTFLNSNSAIQLFLIGLTSWNPKPRTKRQFKLCYDPLASCSKSQATTVSASQRRSP